MNFQNTTIYNQLKKEQEFLSDTYIKDLYIHIYIYKNIYKIFKKL